MPVHALFRADSGKAAACRVNGMADVAANRKESGGEAEAIDGL